VTAPSHTTPTFAQHPDHLVVDVWSDVICPFCYLGEALLSQAVERSGRPVEVRYHSFQLMPELPQGPGRSVVEVLRDLRGVSPEQAEAMNAQVAARGAELGVDLRFDRALTPNTRDAHRLLHLARTRDLQEALARRLFRAYFTDGLDLGVPEVLTDVAVEVGLDRAEVVAALEDGRYAEDVQADIEQARAYGINGVPFFVVDGRYGVSGAQDPAVFVQVLQQAVAERDAA